MKRRRLLIVVEILLAMGAAVWGLPRLFSSSAVKLYGGTSGYAILTEAESVEAVSLNISTEGEDITLAPEIVGKPVQASPAQLQELKSLLSSSDSYAWGRAKGCAPQYGAKLTFRRGNVRIEVLLCFICMYLSVEYDGKRVGGEDFDPITSQLLRITQELLPENEELQLIDKMHSR